MLIGQQKTTQSSFIPGHFYTGMVFLVPKDKTPGTIACSSGHISAFIPFTLETLKNRLEASLVSYGRNVEFRVKQSQTGELVASEVVPLNVPLVKGIVVKCEPDRGILIIDRADIPKKVVAKVKQNQVELALQSCVEFIVVPWNEVIDGEKMDLALRMRKLPPGEVRIFEISAEIYGSIECLPPKDDSGAQAKMTSESMKFGFIKYLRKKTDVLSVFKNSVIAGQVAQKTRPEDLEEKAICFDPESQSCRYTLLEGDCVAFKVRTDMRDRSTEAIDVGLLVPESFAKSHERRLQGMVKSIERDVCRVKRCDAYNKEVTFSVNEVLPSDAQLVIGAEVDFSIKKGHKEAVAQRVVILPKGSITNDWVSAKTFGVVVSVPTTNQSDSDDPDETMGKIQLKDGSNTYAYFKLKNFKTHSGHKSLKWSDIRIGQQVEFLIPPQVNGIKKAVEVKIPQSDLSWRERSNQERSSVDTAETKLALGTRRGYVTSIKENYGFIEVADHSATVFFHKSAFNAMDEVELKWKDEVVFELCETKDGGCRAENVYKLPSGTIAQTEVYAEKCTGKVTCAMRIVQSPNSNEHDRCVGLREYEGVIDIPSVPNKLQVPYSMMSLADTRLIPKQKDQVECKLVHEIIDGKKLPLRAVEVIPTTELKEAFVLSIIKGEYGFLDYKVAPTTKSIFFYNTELLNGTIADLKPGDLVSFYPHMNKKKKTLTAIRVTRIRAGSPSDRKNAAAMNGSSKESEVEAPQSDEPAVDDRPMRLRMCRRTTASVDKENSSGSTNGKTEKNGEVSQQLKTLPKNLITVLREPEFPPDLNTKGFKFQRQTKGPGGPV